MAFTPFAEPAATDAEDGGLVARVKAGDREALQALLGRHLPWIYNLLGADRLHVGMLLCLDREQRLASILGGILGAPDSVGAALLEVSRDAFRQKLARARRDLHRFMHSTPTTARWRC